MLVKSVADELKGFIETSRSIVGREKCSPFSLEDVYHLACYFKLSGIVYLEKLEDRRHVSVLLDLNKDSVLLYDPQLGIKQKPCDEIQIGMYCKPVGRIKDDFQKQMKIRGICRLKDGWARYGQRGLLLLEFLERHVDFQSIYSNRVLSLVDFPALQKNKRSIDCAPICLFVMSLCSSFLEQRVPVGCGWKSVTLPSRSIRERKPSPAALRENYPLTAAAAANIFFTGGNRK